ncbi:MAG: hypothetical protein WCP28_13615 [Actinomycetes bacterium]
MWKQLRTLARQLGSDPAGGVLLFDDVVTTGSTLIEAHRALAQADIPVARAATIATSAKTAAGASKLR